MSADWQLAWRNLWRHRRRTWLTVAAMIVSNVLLIFSISLQLGSYQVMIENTLATFTGHVQVQQRAFQERGRIRNSVPAAQALAAQLREATGLQTVAARSEAFALASSEERSFGIQLIGVEPAHEVGVSTLPGLVRRGRWLGAGDAAEIVLGKTLARNLKVSVGDEVTFLGSGRDGSFAAGVVRVVGILESGFEQIDRVVAEVPVGYFDEAFAMAGHGHRIVLKADTLDDVPQLLSRVRDLVSANPDLAVLDWDALQPGLQQAIRADLTSAWFIYGVLILLVVFSVLNTQLMSVLERTREFGTMMALGIRPGRLSRLVARETLLMSLLGLVLGVLPGFLLAAYLAQVGFTFEGMAEANARFNMPERMYPQVSLAALLWGPGVVFLGAMLACIYPALRLRGLEPVAAMNSA